jgi:hypothetical protein
MQIGEILDAISVHNERGRTSVCCVYSKFMAVALLAF